MKKDEHIKVSPYAKKPPRFIYGKGWSLMNMLIGGAFILSGWIIDIINGLLNLGVIGSGKFPTLFYIWEGIGLFLIIFGVLGWWLVIPAFQKYWHTKRYIFWICLGIALSVLAFVIYQLVAEQIILNKYQ